MHPSPRRLTRRLLTGLAIVMAMLATATSPAAAAQSTEPYDVGFFYGTFNPTDNLLLLAGGTAEDFCEDNAEDPFGAAPGTSTARIQERKDGTTITRVNDSRQPIHLYEVGSLDGPSWINGVCQDWLAGHPVPAPYASGHATLKVRETLSFPTLDIFNRVKGEVTTADGTRYRVRGSADFSVNLLTGELSDIPPNFVTFDLKKRGR